jgi:hypothetical protein
MGIITGKLKQIGDNFVEPTPEKAMNLKQLI